ncbi:MAG: hypothetical protein U0792_25770 [Gemmataceae bacterium]
MFSGSLFLEVFAEAGDQMPKPPEPAPTDAISLAKGAGLSRNTLGSWRRPGGGTTISISGGRVYGASRVQRR